MTSQDAEKAIRFGQVLLFNVAFDGKILGFNEHVVDLLRDSSKDLQHINQIIATQKQFDDAFAKCVASKPPFEPVLLEATIHGGEGDIPFLLSLVRDDEEAVKVLGLSLAPLEKKLIEETKSRLSSLVANELRSPLTGMVGLTTALCKSPALSAPVKKQLGVLRSSSSRLLDLVTNVMDLSQSQTASKVNFGELVEEVVVMASFAVDRSNVPLLKSGVELKNRFPDSASIPLVLGDRNKLLHLLYNLVTNACKFTFAGSVTISAKHLSDSSQLEILVEDTGCGISESSLPRILEPFRIDAARPKQIQAFQGAGLGLAVCKEIAELHHGTLTVQSKEEQGSTFTMKFPCLSEFGPVEDDIPSPAVRPNTAPAQQPAATHRTSPQLKEIVQNKRPLILHVELDAKIQMLFKKSFEDKYEVKGVSKEDWSETLPKDEESPDIVLFDLHAPVVLCHKVCSFVRQLRQPPSLLFSLEAGSILGLQSLREKLKLYDSVIPKPYDVDALQKKFSEVLKEPAKKGVSLEQALLELMSMKTAILEYHCQKATTLEVKPGSRAGSKRTHTRSGCSMLKSKLQQDLEGSEREREPETSKIQRLEQEMALLRARDARLAEQLRYQSCLNQAVLQESGSGTASSSKRFPVEKVDLASFVDDFVAKVQAGTEGTLKRLERFAQGPGSLRNGLKEAAPIVIGNRKMMEKMILKLLEQSPTPTGPVSIVGRQSGSETFEISLDFTNKERHPEIGETGHPARPSMSRSFSLHLLPRHAEKPGKAKRERPLLLAVDDDETQQSVLRSTLGSDFEVVCHTEGKSALEWLGRQTAGDLPDIVLLDVDMPGINGKEVCKSLREKFGLSELPVILLYDGAPSSVAALEGFDSGSNDFISKPFDAQRLKEKVSFNLELNGINVIEEVQKQKIRFLEMRVSEQAAQIGHLRDQCQERKGPSDRSKPDLKAEVEWWKLRRQVAERLLLSQSLGAEVAIT